MRLLALDTCTEACSATVIIDDEAHSQYQIAPRQHSVIILPMIESLLAESGISLKQLDAIAFGCGPGAFTGVRLGASVTQGIALGADLPVIPISTLASLAHTAMRLQGANQVLSAIDARMGEVYYASFQGSSADDLSCIGEEKLSAPESIDLPEPQASIAQWTGIGSGWDTYHQQFLQRSEIVTGSLAFQWLEDKFPNALDIALLAKIQFANGKMLTPEEALPVYIRDKIV